MGTQVGMITSRVQVTVAEPTVLPSPDIRPFPVPLLTAVSIAKALELVPVDRNSAVVAFSSDGKRVEGAVAARLGEHWSFVTMASINPENRGERLGTAVLRFDW